jgi:hypothetical protein
MPKKLTLGNVSIIGSSNVPASYIEKNNQICPLHFDKKSWSIISNFFCTCCTEPMVEQTKAFNSFARCQQIGTTDIIAKHQHPRKK